MAKRNIELSQDTKKAVKETAEVLEAGGVAVFPTETVYGIGVITGNADALAKLRRLKGRAEGKPFQFLAADMEMARHSLGAVFSTKAKKLANNYWPGPLTIVVPDGTGDGTLGIRVPDSLFVYELCKRLERPIIASSANPAGSVPPLSAGAADVFGEEIDILVDGGPIVDGIPSTVVRCIGDEYEILRCGGVSAADIESAWDE